MDVDLLDGKIGSAGVYDVEFKGGKLVAAVGAKFAVGGIDTKLYLNAGEVLDALAKAIPGHFDDVALDFLKSKLLDSKDAA